MERKRHLGLDVGERRIGVALSDELGLTAQPLTVIQNTSARDVHEAIRTLMDDYDAAVVVIGLPRRTDGSYGPEAQRVRAFGRNLAQATGADVVYWDERFSTAEAERTLIAGGARRRRRRQVVDKLAAGIILQSYMDHRRHTTAPPEE